MNEWKQLEERTIHFRFQELVQRKFQMPDGQWVDFEVISGPDVVLVVALTIDQQVILVKQFRPGPMRVLNELPGGTIESKEKPLEAAARELREETGYSGKLEYVGSTYLGGYSSITFHVCVATDCVRSSDLELDVTEFVAPVLVSLEKFRRIVRLGEMSDVGPAYMGLDYLGLL